MSSLTDEQIEALNDFARTHPHLAKVFDYTSSGTKEGLGDALNEDSGVTVSQSDDAASFDNIVSIKFEAASFYITQNAGSLDEVHINFRGTAGAGGGVTDHGDLSGLGDDDHAQYIRVDGTRAFTGNQSIGGNRVTSLGAPVASSDAARLQDVGPGFYGIVFKDGTRAFKDDVLSFNSNDFYLSKDANGNPEINLRKDNTWALHGHFADIPLETVALEEYVPIQQTILSFAGRTSRGSLAVVLRVNDSHQVIWAFGSGAFHKVYFYSTQSIYQALGSNIAQVGSRMQMDFYSISSDADNFSWTLTGTEQF